MQAREVVLVNGKQVPEPIVKSFFMTLHMLRVLGDYRSIHELLRLCNNPAHLLAAESGLRLLSLGLLLDFDAQTGRGTLTGTFCDIIPVAITEAGEGVRVAERAEEIIREVVE